MSSEYCDLHGESDGDTVWISKKNQINDAELLGVLLHESLHYCCTATTFAQKTNTESCACLWTTVDHHELERVVRTVEASEEAASEGAGEAS